MTEVFPGERKVLVTAATLIGGLLGLMCETAVFMALVQCGWVHPRYPTSVWQETHWFMGAALAAGALLGLTLSLVVTLGPE